ncbi:MAG: glycosyltransferase family protein [Geminicoccaceae bacterium]
MTAPARLLIYSHDSFGLGHLRRCRTIAHALVDVYRDLSVLILSGSPIIGSFDFRSRVDFVRVPGVIKLRNGDYTPLQLHIDIDHTLAIRSSIIRHTADVFAPHMFLVDKEPLGLRGEVEDTLRLLKSRGCRLVLGLRDVMDEPSTLVDEWRRKDVWPALRDLYDDIWVYGLPEIFNPVAEIPGMFSIADKIAYTGYLERDLPLMPEGVIEHDLPHEPYILVTAGGGGDGADVVEAVIRAYEHDPAIPWQALIAFGPFMPLEDRLRFQERVHHLRQVDAITFEARFERLVESAAGVIAMGGYNTFCEILSFGKPALIMPRSVPRREQLLRTERAAKLGLVRMLPEDDANNPATMAAHLRDLPNWPAPDQSKVPGLLGGLPRIAELSRPYFDLVRPRLRSQHGGW